MHIDLTNPADLKNILKKYRLWAKKRYGQNFLVDRNILEKIVESGNVTENDTIVEIGPGPGVLTCELLPKAKKVMAIEVDADILPVLKETTHFFRDKLDLVNTHILNIEPPSEPYKLIANIPYHLTSPILRKFLVETNNRPQTMVLLVQKEVAEKICNTKQRSILSLFVEAFGNAKIVEIVPAASFYPPPKVQSAILKIDVDNTPKISAEPKLFFQIVKQGFNQPRKKLKNNLPPTLLEKAGIDPNLRPGELQIADWEKLLKAQQTNVS
jgi:16S rRNA (adenine1518-N6/adenine1519-N6)-dimethyltransferase